MLPRKLQDEASFGLNFFSQFNWVLFTKTFIDCCKVNRD